MRLFSWLQEWMTGQPRTRRAPACRPAALIVPHAGYRYSGAVAAAGYACLPAGRRVAVRRVILLGTAHLRGAEGLIAMSGMAAATLRRVSSGVV